MYASIVNISHLSFMDPKDLFCEYGDYECYQDLAYNNEYMFEHPNFMFVLNKCNNDDVLNIIQTGCVRKLHVTHLALKSCRTLYISIDMYYNYILQNRHADETSMDTVIRNTNMIFPNVAEIHNI